jgi:hypothetical protein
MSEKQEHRWRYILRLQYIAQMETWESREPKLPLPHLLLLIWPGLRAWKNWLEKRPKWEDLQCKRP